MKASEINQIHKEVIALLKAFGYKPEVSKILNTIT